MKKGTVEQGQGAHPTASIFISIVSFHSSSVIENCLRALELQIGLTTGPIVHIVDNASTDNTVDLIRAKSAIKLIINPVNTGFSAGHNRAVYEFLASAAQYLCILNPDLGLKADALSKALNYFDNHPEVDLLTPKLLRANEDLNPLSPPTIDATGMYFTKNLRHLDRGEGQPDSGQFETASEVIGGTGACLFLRRQAVLALLMHPETHPELLEDLYPGIGHQRSKRSPLFDEGFFAYREDADLAWRSSLLGLTCHYVPNVVGYHVRQVRSTERKQTSSLLNRWSVRNRFLLLMNNYHPLQLPQTIIPGLIVRNLLVVAGVLLKERSSQIGLVEAVKLLPRALAWRRELWRRGGEARRPRQNRKLIY